MKKHLQPLMPAALSPEYPAAWPTGTVPGMIGAAGRPNAPFWETGVGLTG